jgi:hypothetical protein
MTSFVPKYVQKQRLEWDNMENNRIDQWLEWTGTAILILGTAVNSLGYYPQGPILLCLGGAFWLAVSIRWRKASLIVVNTIMMATALAGLLWKYFGN